MDGLFRRRTAYSAHTWHAPEPAKYAKYAKYVPSMCRGSWRTMRDWMHLSTANRIAIPARTRLIRELRADCYKPFSANGLPLIQRYCPEPGAFDLGRAKRKKTSGFVPLALIDCHGRRTSREYESPARLWTCAGAVCTVGLGSHRPSTRTYGNSAFETTSDHGVRS